MTKKRVRNTGTPDYLRLDEAAVKFAMSEGSVRKIAVECNALRKKDKIILINYQILKDYIETFEAFE